MFDLNVDKYTFETNFKHGLDPVLILMVSGFGFRKFLFLNNYIGLKT